MAEKVRVTEAKAHLSELMARVGYGGERFVIERRGRPLAALVGVEDLERLEKGDSTSRPVGAIGLVRAWGEAEEPEVDDVNDKPEGKSERTHEQGATRVINLADPARGEDTGEFQGHHYEAGISFIVVAAPPGGGPKLHRHPYEEVFVVQEGHATFTAGEETIEAGGGQVVVVHAGVPHKFVNSGTGRLRQLDIHASDRFVTEWLED